MTFPVRKFGLIFRLVEESDAPFILSLRTDPKLAQHLSATENDLERQISWIRAYKQREATGAEYYVLYENEEHYPLGLVRLYNITAETFTSGSWIVRPGTDEWVALRADLFIFSYAFDELKLNKCLIDVRKENKKVLNYHRRFFSEIGEDEENIYFEMDRGEYERKIRFLKSVLTID